jgi:multiple sugar transport system permease protein
VGWDNFRALFSDPIFGISLRNSVEWGILLNLFGLPIELGIALCLASVKRFRTLYQTLIFVPVVLSLVSVVVLARYLLDPMIGPIDRYLADLHLPTSPFLQSSDSALPTLVGFAIWKGWGITVVILTAGLMNIPRELLEAAEVDGTNAWHRFWHITLPLLQPTLNFVVVLGVINALQEYTIPTVMTGGSGGVSGGGGPDNATTLLNMYIYNVGIGNLQFGQAAAASLIEFAFTLFLTLVVLRALRMRWSY